jgi:hypothetical protein
VCETHPLLTLHSNTSTSVSESECAAPWPASVLPSARRKDQIGERAADGGRHLHLVLASACARLGTARPTRERSAPAPRAWNVTGRIVAGTFGTCRPRQPCARDDVQGRDAIWHARRNDLPPSGECRYRTAPPSGVIPLRNRSNHDPTARLIGGPGWVVAMGLARLSSPRESTHFRGIPSRVTFWY